MDLFLFRRTSLPKQLSIDLNRALIVGHPANLTLHCQVLMAARDWILLDNLEEEILTTPTTTQMPHH